MRRVSRETGFTLLEVMIGLAVTGGLLITLIYTLNFNLMLADRQLAVTNMINLAGEKMNELRLNPQAGKGTFDKPFAGYSYETSVRESTVPSWSEIDVAIEFGKERITLSELIRKPK
jgi:type II secretory pathway pseudopilin PulG